MARNSRLPMALPAPRDVSLGEAASLLRAARTSLIVVHRNPDGDCVGSAAALATTLMAIGKQVALVCPDPLPDYLLDVPGTKQIVQRIDGDDWDLVVAIDVSDPGLLAPLPCTTAEYFLARNSLNLDHHFSNTRFARHNYVDVHAASASEIVGALITRELGMPLTPEIAADLLYGIVNDTHSFQNSNTTPETLRFSADLVEAGANLGRIVYNLLLERRASSARLWALVLPTLTFADDEHVAFLTVTLDALARASADLSDADGLVDFLRNIHGVDLAVLLKQTAGNAYRLSFRTSAEVDATEVAGVFGGGGHKRASGGDVTGSLPDIQAEILNAYGIARRRVTG